MLLSEVKLAENVCNKHGHDLFKYNTFYAYLCDEIFHISNTQLPTLLTF